MKIIDYDKIIGATVNAVYVDKRGQENLLLSTDMGYFLLVTYGDCCSMTFVSDIIRCDLGKIVSVETIPLEEDILPYREPRQEYDSVFGLRFCLEPIEGRYGQELSQSITIGFRNSSNGYYGGWIDGLQHLEEVNLEDYIRVDGRSLPIIFE